jgi:hypothetical protein
MSNVVAPKAAKSAAAPDKAEALRDVQPKRFPSSDFHPTGQDYEILHVSAGPDWTWDDVIDPIAWSHVCRKVAKDALQHRKEKTGTTIYVHGANFFAMLNIDAVIYDQLGNPNGLKVTCIGPATDLETGKLCPVDLKTGRALVAPKSTKAAA